MKNNRKKIETATEQEHYRQIKDICYILVMNAYNTIKKNNFLNYYI